MKFEKILPKFLRGKKIRRRCWEKGAFIYVKDGESYVGFKKISYSDEILLFKFESLKADDWEVYDDTEYFHWKKAHQLLRSGFKVKRAEWTGCWYIWLDNKTGHFYYRIDDDIYLYNLKSHDLDAYDWCLEDE